MNFIRLLVIASGFFVCCGTIMNTAKFENGEYNIAYKYILDDRDRKTGNDLEVADSIVHVDMSSFFQELSVEWGRSDKSTLRELDSLDNVSSLASKFSVTLSELKDSTPSSYTVYFSDKYKNIIVGELLEKNQENKSNSFSSKRRFTTGMQYLFIFDVNGKLKRVHKKEISID